MLIDPSVTRKDVIAVTNGLTPAKLLAVAKTLNIVEIMMGIQKMRARRTPANQAHCTSARDNPLQVACEAAEAALRGFAEVETTLGVVRYAPLVAMAQQIGSQVDVGGPLTQCALEEATELDLGMRGITGYAETISVYGTEPVFVDGDDTPWSKAFLAAAYASRGIKMRFTSGTGSEVQMGNAQGKSMLYLEIRCILVAKGAGVQGLQNGSISCIGVPVRCPAGIRAVAAENLIASAVDLECASGNDQSFSHSPMRRTARLMPQMMPGTDFVCSGYSAVPNYDNMFAGSNLDSDDFDDFNTIQRDLQIDGGLRHVKESEILAARTRAAKALQAVFGYLDLPPITDAEIEAAVYANGSQDLLPRDVLEDLKGAQQVMDRNMTGLDLVKALEATGFTDMAENVLAVLRQRISGDLLQTSAIMTPSLVPAVGGQRRERLRGSGHRIPPVGRTLGRNEEAAPRHERIEPGSRGGMTVSTKPKVPSGTLSFSEIGPAERGKRPDEVVIAISPAFGSLFSQTIVDIPHVRGDPPDAGGYRGAGGQCTDHPGPATAPTWR